MSINCPPGAGAALRFAGWGVVAAVAAGRLRVRAEAAVDDGAFDVHPPAGCEPGALPPGTRVFILMPEEGVGVVAAAPGLQAASPGATLYRNGPILRVEDGDGRLLFEYDEESRRTTVAVPRGDLEIRVASGALRISAAAGVSVAAPNMEVVADRAAARVGALTLLAGRVLSRVRVHRATVEELSELRVGKLRLFARLGMLLKAQKATVTTDDDLILRGGTIRMN